MILFKVFCHTDENTVITKFIQGVGTWEWHVPGSLNQLLLPHPAPGTGKPFSSVYVFCCWLRFFSYCFFLHLKSLIDSGERTLWKSAHYFLLAVLLRKRHLFPGKKSLLPSNRKPNLSHTEVDPWFCRKSGLGRNLKQWCTLSLFWFFRDIPAPQTYPHWTLCSCYTQVIDVDEEDWQQNVFLFLMQNTCLWSQLRFWRGVRFLSACVGLGSALELGGKEQTLSFL